MAIGILSESDQLRWAGLFTNFSTGMNDLVLEDGSFQKSWVWN